MEVSRRDLIRATVLIPIAPLLEDGHHDRLRRLVQNPPFRLVCVHPSLADVIDPVARYGVVLTHVVPEHLVWSCEHIDLNDDALRISNEYTRRAKAPGSILVAWRRVRRW